MRQVPLKSEWKLTLLSAIGSGLEYYCFVCYILLSNYLSLALFPANQHIANAISSLVVFALGYVVTPLSAVAFGHFADKFGRKKIFTFSLFLMSSATFLMGLIPSYAAIGISATVLLIILRIAQGISQGAELPGAITFICEHIHSAHRGRYCGLLFLGVGSGAMLGSFINFLITRFLTHAAMQHFGWRIPFLIAGVLGMVGYLIRRRTTETPLFLAQNKNSIAPVPIKILWREHWRKVLIGIGIVWLGACLVSFGLFLPSFLQMNFGFSADQTYLALTLTFAFDVLLIVFGDWSDRVGRKQLYLTGVMLNLILIYPLFQLLRMKTLLALYAFNIVYHLLILLLASCYPSMLAELFPTNVRYSGVAASYLGAYSLAGATPLLVVTLYLHVPHVAIVATWFMVCALVSLFAGMGYRQADNEMVKRSNLDIL